MKEIDNIVREVARYADKFGISLSLEFSPAKLQYILILERGNRATRTVIDYEMVKDATKRGLYIGLCDYVNYMNDCYFIKEELSDDN